MRWKGKLFVKDCEAFRTEIDINPKVDRWLRRMATIYRGSLWNLEWICFAVELDRLRPGSGGRWNKFQEAYAPCAFCTGRWKTRPAMFSARAAATRFRWRTLCPAAWIHVSTRSCANAGCTNTPQSTRVRIELEKPFSMSLHRPVEHNWTESRESFCFIATKMFSELSYHNHSQVAFIYGVPLESMMRQFRSHIYRLRLCEWR